MQKPRSHVIDTLAVQIFERALPPEEWTVQSDLPDRGIDFKVELVERDAHTGLYFWVQLKGQDNVERLKDGTISFKLETKHLAYWITVPTPVFLVVVDVKSQEGWWIFLQEYEQIRRKSIDWRGRKTIKIQLPAQNSLADPASLRSAVKRAIGFMARRSLGLGIDHAQSSWKRLDPRFDVRVQATAAGETVRANALEDVRISLKFGDGFRQTGKLAALIGRGVPVAIEPGDVTVEGSLLIGSMMDSTAEIRGTLHLGLNGAGHIRLTHLDRDGREVSRPHELKAEFEGGLQEARFSSQSLYGSFALRGVIKSGPGSPTPLNMRHDLGRWGGRPLSSLPDFDLVRDLLGGVEVGHRIKIDIFMEATQVASGTMIWREREIEEVRQALDFLELVSQARWIADKFGVNAVLPRRMSDDQALEIVKLYHVSTDGEVRLKGVIESSRARLTNPDMRSLSETIGLAGDSMSLELYSDAPQPFLGLEVNLGPLKKQLSCMRLATDGEKLVQQIRDGVSPIDVTWKATPETELIITRVDEKQMAAIEAAMEPHESSKESNDSQASERE